ncbi:MAG: hypothetical protein P4L33_18390 [Capsulimonadaceae bacterium]|nr:hypothetical protein [Capsulimonadaceae bacterium]
MNMQSDDAGSQQGADETLRSQDGDYSDQTGSESARLLSAKKAKKRLKDGEHDLRRELQRYKDVLKKAKHEHGSVPAAHDREKLKKAEWMHSSIKHYLKELDKKQAADALILSESFHEEVAQSIDDLKRVRKALKAETKSAD